MFTKILIANQGAIASYGLVECAADVLRLLGHNMPPEGLSEAAE